MDKYVQSVIGVLLVCLCASSCSATRSLPVDSENFAIKLFRKVNPSLEYDSTNFLVDAAGPYSECRNTHRRGWFSVPVKTQDGVSIGGLRDTIVGEGKHTRAVKQYIQSSLPGWIQDFNFLDQIRKADHFGCSVRPGCGGHLNIACLFSPSYDPAGGPGDIVQDATQSPSEGQQNALAFTKEQYATAEALMGGKMIWDRSHFLENLSGYETKCAMLNQQEWRFPFAHQVAKKYNLDIQGYFGFSENTGSTQAGIDVILASLKGSFKKMADSGLTDVGCSVIPDCTSSGSMYVVVSCLFSRETQHLELGDIVQDATAPPLTGKQYALAFTREQYKLAESQMGAGMIWDRSHFLENLSGYETQCAMLNQYEWSFPFAHQVAGKYSLDIQGYFGFTQNRGSTQEAIDFILESLKGGFKKMAESGLTDVGCSVIPDCMASGTIYVVVSCLFSRDTQDLELEDLIQDATEPPITGTQYALAFTRHQYKWAELHIGISMKWDHSHFLENLSGYETKCEMLNHQEWEFKFAHQEAAKRKQSILGYFGVVENLGNTQTAMNEIFDSWRHKVQKLTTSGISDFGCSVIPDCKSPRHMYVVVSCIFA